jgi:predicted dithiol-disulfide oxidoreductase (DUF899 family)
MSSTAPALPKIVSRDEWLLARKALLAKEKALTRHYDAVSADRRRLPMVEIDADYAFEGNDGKASLIDLFEGRRQLYVHHFMWIDANDAACHRCANAADINFAPANLLHFHSRDIAFAAIARAPWPKLAALKARKGWTFPLYSSFGTTFNYDFHVTLDETVAPLEYNYRNKAELLETGVPASMLRGDWPGNSVFLRDGDRVYHTYSAYARGLDSVDTPSNFLDLTVYGRQEDWEVTTRLAAEADLRLNARDQADSSAHSVTAGGLFRNTPPPMLWNSRSSRRRYHFAGRRWTSESVRARSQWSQSSSVSTPR